MAKALSIKDEATYQLVAEIAAKTGLSMTQSVKAAAKAHLDQLEKARRGELNAWVKRMQDNPLPADFEFDRDTAPYTPRAGWTE
jgi:hypothetical protein